MHYIEFRFFEILHFCHNMKDLSNNHLKLIHESFNMKLIKLLIYTYLFGFILQFISLRTKQLIKDNTKCNNPLLTALKFQFDIGFFLSKDFINTSQI